MDDRSLSLWGTGKEGWGCWHWEIWIWPDAVPLERWTTPGVGTLLHAVMRVIARKTRCSGKWMRRGSAASGGPWHSHLFPFRPHGRVDLGAGGCSLIGRWRPWWQIGQRWGRFSSARRCEGTWWQSLANVAMGGTVSGLFVGGTRVPFSCRFLGFIDKKKNKNNWNSQSPEHTEPLLWIHPPLWIKYWLAS